MLDIVYKVADNTNMNLLNETIALLRNTKVSKSDICKQCQVSPRWLSYLAAKDDREFSITKVQAVYDFLTSSNIEAA